MIDIGMWSLAGKAYKRFHHVRGRVFHPTRSLRHPIIGMYHGISDLGRQTWGPWQYTVTPAEFETHLNSLTSAYSIISLEELLGWVVAGESIPSESIILTFDDGYKNFITEALPILEQYNAPATVYVSTEFAGGRLPFEQQLAQILDQQESISVKLGETSIKKSLETQKDTIQAYKRLQRIGKHERTNWRTELLAQIGSSSSSETEMMSVKDVRKAHDHPLVTVGAHGSEHVPLASMSTDEQIQNINNSHNWLAEILGEPAGHFSFPYGSTDRSAIKAVREAGFKSAVTTEQRCVTPCDWDRPYSLPRVDFSNTEVIKSVTERTHT